MEEKQPELYDRSRVEEYGVPELKENVQALLQEAYGENKLSLDEYERRISIAEKAQTKLELQEVISDFPDKQRVREKKEPLPAVESSGDIVLSIIGDRNVDVSETEKENITALSIIGDLTIDYRKKNNLPQNISINHVSIIGDTVIKVPKNVKVIKNFFTLIGDVKHQKCKNSEGYDRVITLKGFKLIGDLTIIEE